MKGSQAVMSDSRAVVTNGWSTLNTVDEFDNGLSKNTKNILPKNENISKTIVKSLFVESLIDHLCKLLEKDPVKRRKLYDKICNKLYDMQLIEETYRIEELASLRSHFQQALLDVMVAPDARLCTLPQSTLGSSRYATEYEEMSFIASGGFGKVFKAKNRLDQVTYAVKKISLRSQNLHTFARKINEVKTLAKLNHPNIVQYKGAWLEPILNFQTPITAVEVPSLGSSDSDIVVFQSNPSSNSQLSEEEDERNKNLAVCKCQREGSIQRSVPEVCALLYVTMQLCDITLSDWVYKRSLYKESLNIPLVLNMMIQTVAGVQYIHSCNIVHHDIKPRNIFLSKDLKSLQVGDFGLSCCLQGHDHSECPLEVGQFGTPLYAAPEQLKGHCNPKSDMFSLGLIFIELLTILSTEMERSIVLTNARSGLLPPSIPVVFVPVIKSLISHQVSSRPTATELLSTLQKLKETISDIKEKDSISDNKDKDTISDNKDSIESDTSAHEILDLLSKEKERLLEDKDKEIRFLKKMLAQRENEIAELKHFISQCST